MGLDGDPESALGLNKYLGVLARVRQHTRAVTRWQEAGSMVDVAAYLAGEPECMMEMVPARRPSPVIRIAIERCVSFFTSAEEMRATGASALAIVEALRTAGVPAEIWVTFTTGWPTRKSVLSEQVLVQEPGRPIDLDRLAFWAANPAAFRRLAFALYEQEPSEIRNEFHIYTGGGYGSANSRPPNEDFFDEVAPSDSYSCERWVREVLNRRAGIELLDANFEEVR